MGVNKKGQGVFGLSFGAIFSIIVIVFIIAVAFFAIRHFLVLNQCAQLGLFYEDLNKEVERAWTSGMYRDEFKAELPQSGFFGTKIDYVCFGKLNSTNIDNVLSVTPQINEELKNGYFDPDGGENVFLIPPAEACGESLAGYELKCRDRKSACMSTNNEFFCIHITKGELKVWLTKETTDPLVRVTKT